jgi:hypothetical protein
MATQLVLIDETKRDWTIDERTREVGRRGLSEARAALAVAAQRSAQRSERSEHAAAERRAA